MTASGTASPSRWPHAYVVLGLLGLVFASLGRVIGHDFISLDDPIYVTYNRYVVTGLSWRNFQYACTTVDAGLWHPLTFLSLQVDTSLWGGKAWGYHLTNLLWHAVNVLLLYGWLYTALGSQARGALVAALFAVHPMHVESIAWITERKDVLCAFFALCSLWAYWRYVRTSSRFSYFLVALCLFLGHCCKPMLITWPFVLLLLDYWPLGRLTPGESGVKPWLRLFARRVWEKMPLLVINAACIGMILYIHGHLAGQNNDYPWSFRIANVLYAVGWYVGRTFWPVNLAGFYPSEALSWNDPRVVWGVIVCMGVLVWLTWALGRRPEQLVGWLWFLGMLFPVLGFMPSDFAVAPRFTYLPHIGLFLALVWGAGDLLTRWRVARSLQTVVACFVVVALAAQTWRQAGYWKDDQTLWQHTIEVTSANNHRAVGTMAVHYFLREEWDLSFPYAEKAFHLPRHGDRYGLMYGIMLLQKGRLDEALHVLRAFQAYDPNDRVVPGQIERVLEAQRKARGP